MSVPANCFHIDFSGIRKPFPQLRSPFLTLFAVSLRLDGDVFFVEREGLAVNPHIEAKIQVQRDPIAVNNAIQLRPVDVIGSRFLFGRKK